MQIKFSGGKDNSLTRKDVKDAHLLKVVNTFTIWVNFDLWLHRPQFCDPIGLWFSNGGAAYSISFSFLGCLFSLPQKFHVTHVETYGWTQRHRQCEKDGFSKQDN